MKYKLLLLFFSISTFSIKAAVVYVDFVPDSVLDLSYETIYVDLDNDGTNDFTFFKDIYNNTPFLHIDETANNFVVGSAGTAAFGNDEASPLSVNTTIDNNNTYVYSPQNPNGVLLAQVPANYPIFAGLGDKYIGLKFKIGNNTHYGWFLVDINAAGSICTIKSYAYENTPNTAIQAGNMGLGINNYTTNSMFEVFPNPTINFVTVKSNSNFETTAKLINLEGCMVKYAILKPSTSFVLDVTNLPKGMYFLQLMDNKAIQIKKLQVE